MQWDILFFFNSVLLGVGLAMDAFSVSLANGLNEPRMSRRRMLGLRDENVQLQKKIEEIRLVDRAKCVLIQVLSMTEPQAHRYLEKEAMDRRVTRREVAEQVLRTYEPST